MTATITLSTDFGTRDNCYAEVGLGGLLALIGSEGLLEVAVRDGSAAVVTGAGAGAPVEIGTDEPAAT